MKHLKKNSLNLKKFLEKLSKNDYYFLTSFYSKEYKKWAKEKTTGILSNPTSSNFLILLLPFLLNLSQIIFLKYKDQTFSVFLEKNLPGCSSPYETFFWQTFQYFNDENFNSLKKLKRIDFYNEFILLEKKALSPSFESQIFLANFPQSTQKSDCLSLEKNEKITYDGVVGSLNTELKPNFYFLHPREFCISSNSFFYNLDQFPLKINTSFYKNQNKFEEKSFSSLTQTNIKEIFFNNTLKKKSLLKNKKGAFLFNKKSQNLIFDKNDERNNVSLSFQKENQMITLKQPKFILKKIIFYNSNFNKIHSISKNKANVENKNILKFIFLKNKKLKNKLFSERNQIKNDTFFNQNKNLYFSFFQNEFDTFFYKKFLQPTTKVLDTNRLEQNEFLKTSKNSDLQSFFSNVCSETLIQLVNELTLKEENFFLKPRVMSGYFYPDWNKKNVKSYFLEFFFKKKLNTNKILRNFNLKKSSFYTATSSKIKIFLPLSFYKENFVPTNLSTIELQYKPTFFEGVQYRQILYQGPGVVLDETTKDIYLKNKKQIQNWFKTIFYSDNPLSDRKNNFFGKKNYVSNEVLHPNSHILKNNFHLVDKNLNISKDKFVNITTIYPFIEDYRVPYLEEQQWRLILETLKEESVKDNSFNTLKEQFDSLEDNKLNVSIPLIRIKYPKQKPIIWPLTLLDYYNPKLHKSYNSLLKISLNELILNKIFNSSKNQNKIFFDHSSPIFIKNKNYGGINQKIFSLYPNLKIKKTHEKNKYSKNEIFANLEEFNTLSSKEIFYKENILFDKNGVNTVENPVSFLDIFEKKILKYFSHSFYQKWQSINLLSFFIIAQFSFGFFILQILQDFYKKYGKELVSYLLDIVSSLGILDEGLKEDLQLDENEKGFRVIYKNQKQFHHIAGIDRILPELGEIVWFLRNSARSFKIGNILPKGILLIGPPGTGKTFLVQAIAGESEVPVLIQSGSSLNESDQQGAGAQKLRNLFEKARELAPCIVFIDEIDTIGEKRQHIIKNPMGSDELIESMYEFDSAFNGNFQDSSVDNFFFSKTTVSETEDEEEDNVLSKFEIGYEQRFTLKAIEKTIAQNQLKQHQLSLLMQFLVELDGLQSRKGIVVIGATNRPNVLDSALTRPGRFDKVFYLDLPNKEKRIEIFKLYSTNLGIDKNLSWDYLANRTYGFSAADLAAVMNESSIQAIIKDTVHTVETIEQGILFITSYSTESISLNLDKIKDPFYFTRFAYYQCGKALLHTLLPNHPSAIVVYLWPRPKNPRHTQFSRFLETSSLKINYKVELEDRLIGLYAGKAAEIFSLIKNASNFLNKKTSISKNTSIATRNVNNEKNIKVNFVPSLSKGKRKQIFNTKDFKNLSLNLYWQSDLGFDDLNSALLLSYYMIDKWYFYSKNVIIKKYHEILETKNELEISEIEILEVLKLLIIERQKNIFQEKKPFNPEQIYQEWSIRAWWQAEVFYQASAVEAFFSEWYRLYLPNPEETELNEEWIPPDIYCHGNDSLVNLAKKSKNASIMLNNLYSIDRDYLGHSLFLLCFNKAFSLLNNNREILDYFVDYLLRHEILRQSDIVTLFHKFNLSIKSSNTSDYDIGFQTTNKLFVILEPKWGKNSRKTTSHFINFEKLKYTLENKNSEKFNNKK